MNEFKVPTGLPKIKADNPDILQVNTAEKPLQDVKKRTEIKPKQIECPYIEPPWSETPNQNIEYKFEVLKSGSIVEEFRDLQTRPFWLFGRLPENDILMAHPTISRYHAVLQYCPKNTDGLDEDKTNLPSSMESGWYIYDIDSTHGTFLNKMRIPPRTFIRMKVGHMLKLGASTRHFILHGPDFDEEPESELTVTELINLREQKKVEKQKYEEMQQKMREKEGIDWGMAEDADEETDLSINPYATTNNEELFLDDPKKTLRGFFEREGLDLDYKCDEMSPGTFVCRIELPLDDSNGKPIIAEVCHKGKKKECVVQCALEACRILDRHGILRQAHHEPLKRKVKTSDSDDDDDFLDRTGDIARKKLRKENHTQNSALSYDVLISQEKELAQNIATVENDILKYQENLKRCKENNKQNGEDLDDYMENLSQKTITVDKTEIRKLRVEHQRLLIEQQKNQKLIKIAKPIDILTPLTSSVESTDTNKKKLILPLFGKRNQYKFSAIQKTETKPEFCDKIDSKLNTEEEDETTNEILEEKVNKQKPSTNKNNETMEIKQNSVTENMIIEKYEYKNEESEIPEKEIPKEKVVHESENLCVNKSTLSGNTSIKSDGNINIGDTEADDNINSKKRRNRPRNRNRRENVDIDDTREFDDADKHSEWIPPTNQTGDGMTNLNSKFGY